ncbi:MAG: TetR/AcrR family transcriptional regulator [Acidimicrobiaceae bacterium]|nr:TetR/AcrR family transcriptional regulator [Acidimicrobiaceae bacterium]
MAIVERTRQKERREESTEALLRAAGELVLEGGISAMTFAAIGERSGYSRSLVTVRFGSKEGLVEELLVQLVRDWSHRSVPEPDESATALDRIAATLEAIQRQIDKNSRGVRVLYALMFEGRGDESFLRDRFGRFHEEQRATFAKWVEAGQAEGSVAVDLDAADEAAFIVAGLRGIGYQWLVDPDGFDASRAFAHFLGLVVDRLDTVSAVDRTVLSRLEAVADQSVCNTS